MSIAETDLVWQQGEDNEISILYSSPTPVDLSAYSLRMDVATDYGVASLYTFNSDDSDALTDDEAYLGADGTIVIVIPRTVSLPGGALAGSLNVPLRFDLFLRSPVATHYPDGKQTKILRGTVTIEESITLWQT